MKGRPRIEVDEGRFKAVYSQAVRGEITHNYAMSILGLKRNTYYRLVKRFQLGKVGRE
jgi:transcriptional regulator of acetoin/glycerol metabolism